MTLLIRHIIDGKRTVKHAAPGAVLLLLVKTQHSSELGVEARGHRAEERAAVTSDTPLHMRDARDGASSR